MTYNLYKYDGEHTVLDKQLGTPEVRTGTFRGNYSMMNPTLTLQGSYSGQNYVEINGIYYFVTAVDQERTDLFTLSLKKDVLMTYRDQIKALPCVVRRNGTWNNPDVYDPDLGVLQRTQSYMSKIGSDFEYSTYYVLVTVG